MKAELRIRPHGPTQTRVTLECIHALTTAIIITPTGMDTEQFQDDSIMAAAIKHLDTCRCGMWLLSAHERRN